MRHETICAACGKKFVHYHDCGRKCCSRECRKKHGYKRESHAIIITCEICGKQFENWKNRAPRRFCSKACRLKAGWIKADPSKHSIFTCEWCGKEFEEWTYRQPRFCSSQCRSEYAAHLPKPWQAKPEIHITLQCRYCGKDYETTTHQLRLRGSHFCSIKCRGAQMSIERRGENNPHYNGGHVNDYGPNWHSQRRKATRRDNHTCQICGYKSGGDTILDVHHITQVKEYNGDWEKANHLSNLICLCRNCHSRVEQGEVTCPSPECSPPRR